jgi:hypothetical protein
MRREPRRDAVRRRLRRSWAAGLLALAAAPALAERPPAESPVGRGPEDVTREIQEIDEEKTGRIPLAVLDSALDTWSGFKRGLDERLGLELGIAWTALYQRASTSPGKRQAAGGILELEGTWTLIGRGTRDPGMLGFTVEDRHRIGTDIPPQSLSGEIGSAWQTGTGYSSFDIALVELWWEQHLFDGRAGFRVGKVLPNSIYDSHSFKSFKTGFTNAAFSRSPAIVQPSFGLGAVVGLLPTPTTYVLAGIHDANGSPRDDGFDTFFQDREYFLAGEFGWKPEFELGEGLYHVTAWRVSERREAGVPKGWGISGLAQQRMGRLLPFVRYGYANGRATTVEHLVALGLTFLEAFGNDRDVIGIGLSWGRPTSGDLRDQWAGELFYRAQVLPNLAVTPSIQGILNPAANRDDRAIGVFGIRARLTF